MRAGYNDPAAAAHYAAGTGGDFRFHGGWLEVDTRYYHMRARDYDSDTGRFLERDPWEGDIQTPETLHPYTFANSNPYYYSDPTGLFSIAEINFTSASQFGGRSIRAYGAHAIKQRVRRQIGQVITQSLEKQIKNLIPNFDLPSPNPRDAGNQFEDYMRRAFRNLFCDALLDVPEWAYLEAPVNTDGKALADGISCGREVTQSEEAFYAKFGVPRPDFILSSSPPQKGRSWVIGDFKGRTGTLYRDYFGSGNPKSRDQFQSILNYARKGTFSKTALFVVATDKNSVKSDIIRKELIRRGISKGTLVLLVVVID
jgi:RHS repeat-associated protein